MINDAAIIKPVKNWLHNVIVGLDFCPFAGRELERNTIRYVVDHSTTAEDRLHLLIDECFYLDKNTSTETTLIIFPASLDEFDLFLDFIELANTLLNQQGYEGTYQLAHFHPHYQFENTRTDDAENYTNRSPYPVLHLIREASIEKVLQHYPDAESIPERNIELARKKGTLQMQALLDAALTDN